MAVIGAETLVALPAGSSLSDHGLIQLTEQVAREPEKVSLLDQRHNQSRQDANRVDQQMSGYANGQITPALDYPG